MDSTPDLSLVRHLRGKGRFQEAERQLQEWLKSDPDNPRLLLEMAIVLDNQGAEAKAIEYYEKSLNKGLSQAYRLDALIGLGSSLRVVGRVRESHTVLSQAVQEFPQDDAAPVFYALTLEKMGDFGSAITALLDVILRVGGSPSLNKYYPSLRYYRDYRHDQSKDGVDTP